MQYSYLLHFHIHEFVMQARKCKRHRGSAEYSFRELQWIRADRVHNKCMEPMRWLLLLAGVTHPTLPIHDECLMFASACVSSCFSWTCMQVNSSASLQRYSRRGFPFNVLSDLGVTQRCKHQHMCLGIYPIQVSGFTPRMGNVIVILMNNKHPFPVILGREVLEKGFNLSCINKMWHFWLNLKLWRKLWTLIIGVC